MQPSEITAHETDSIGPKLPPRTHIFSLRHLATGAEILAKAGLRGERPSCGPAPWPAYRALKQFVGITFRIERAQRLDCLSRCFPEMRLVTTLSGCVACFSIFFDNINQLPKRYVVTRKVIRIIKKCHRSSNKPYKSSSTLHKVVLKNRQYRLKKISRHLLQRRERSCPLLIIHPKPAAAAAAVPAPPIGNGKRDRHRRGATRPHPRRATERGRGRRSPSRRRAIPLSRRRIGRHGQKRRGCAPLLRAAPR